MTTKYTIRNWWFGTAVAVITQKRKWKFETLYPDATAGEIANPFGHSTSIAYLISQIENPVI